MHGTRHAMDNILQHATSHKLTALPSTRHERREGMSLSSNILSATHSQT